MSVLPLFQKLRTELQNSLIERDTEIEIALTALVAGENVLFVGPPGTAKSMLCDSLAEWFAGPKFGITLNKTSTPEELFGPIDLPGLKAGRYGRLVDGYLPTAVVAVVDEVWKASSAILNTLLKIANERTFKCGAQEIKCPLRLMFAASNEWPPADGAKELAAMFDRFLLRHTVKEVVTESGIERLMYGGDHRPRISGRCTEADLLAATLEAKSLPWTDEAKQALARIRHECRHAGISPGDRRKVKAVGVAQAYAWLQGATEVLPEHLEILSAVWWDAPEEQPQKAAEIIGRIANPAAMKCNELLTQAQEIIGQTNVQDPASYTAGAKKLSAVIKELVSLGSDQRVRKAADYVRGEFARLKNEYVNSQPA